MIPPVNDSHSPDCLLSGGRSWIKPLTGSQAVLLSKGATSSGPRSSPRPDPPASNLMESKQTDNFFQLAQPGQPNTFEFVPQDVRALLHVLQRMKTNGVLWSC